MHFYGSLWVHIGSYAFFFFLIMGPDRYLGVFMRPCRSLGVLVSSYAS